MARSALDRGAELPVPSFLDARFTLAEVLHRAGREEEAAEAATRCLERYEAKGIVPLVQKAEAAARRGSGPEVRARNGEDVG